MKKEFEDSGYTIECPIEGLLVVKNFITQEEIQEYMNMINNVTEKQWDEWYMSQLKVFTKQKFGREDVDNLVKAKNALTGVGAMTISVEVDLNGDNMCLFTFGDEQGHNNKITYQMYGTITVSYTHLTLPTNREV